jgi:hypothetical protein
LTSMATWPGFGLRIGTLLDVKDFGTAILLDDNCAHLRCSVEGSAAH